MDEKGTNFALLAIVAIVAIVALVVLLKAQAAPGIGQGKNVEGRVAAVPDGGAGQLIRQTDALSFTYDTSLMTDEQAKEHFKQVLVSKEASLGGSCWSCCTCSGGACECWVRCDARPGEPKACP